MITWIASKAVDNGEYTKRNIMRPAMEINIFLFLPYICLVLTNFLYGVWRNKRGREISLKAGKSYFDFGNMLALALMIFLAVLIVMDRDNPDYVNYQLAYNLYNVQNGTDVGFAFLKELAINQGWSFDLFRTIIVVISFLLTYLGIRKLGVQSNIAIALYAVYPFTYDAIQFANTLAFSIIFYTIPNLIHGQKKDRLKFIIAVAIATTIHAMSLVYFLLLLVKWDEEYRQRGRKMLRFAFLGAIALSLLNKVFPAIGLMIENIFLSYSDAYRGNHYTRGAGVDWGFIVPIALELFFLALLYYCNRSQKDNLKSNTHNEMISESIYEFNLAIVCASPTLLITTEFMRIFRNMLLLNYLGISTALGGCENCNSKRMLKIMFLAVYVLNIIVQFVLFAGHNKNAFWCFFN